MDMVTYIREIEHAVSSVMKDIWEDRRIFQDLESRLKGLTNKTEDGYRRIQNLLENDDLDSDLLATAAHWDTYFGVDKDRFHAYKELTAKKQVLLVHDFSVRSISSMPLRFAKQGLSALHGGLSQSPGGRSVGNQDLKTVIFGARNQSLHWE